MKNEVSLPWKMCLLGGAIFGAALIKGGQHRGWVWDLIQYLEFHKLNWKGFGYSGLVIVLLMALLPEKLDDALDDARPVFAFLIALLFNGMVGGYLGIAIWDLSIGETRDGIEFICCAWISYVWFFLALDVVEHGVP